MEVESSKPKFLEKICLFDILLPLSKKSKEKNIHKIDKRKCDGYKRITMALFSICILIVFCIILGIFVFERDKRSPFRRAPTKG